MLQHWSSLCHGVHAGVLYRDMALAGNCSGTKGENMHVLHVGKSRNVAVTVHAGEVIHKPATTETAISSSCRERKGQGESLVSCCWGDHWQQHCSPQGQWAPFSPMLGGKTNYRINISMGDSSLLPQSTPQTEPVLCTGRNIHPHRSSYSIHCLCLQRFSHPFIWSHFPIWHTVENATVDGCWGIPERLCCVLEARVKTSELTTAPR